MPHKSQEYTEHVPVFLFISKLENPRTLQDQVVGMLGREKGREEVVLKDEIAAGFF